MKKPAVGRTHIYSFYDRASAVVEVEPDEKHDGIGFRLVCTRVAFQETRGRCWQSRTQYPDWQLERQDGTADHVVFRLTKDST